MANNCQYILKKGARAGEKCGRNCRGDFCKDHNEKKQEYMYTYSQKLNNDQKIARLNRKIGEGAHKYFNLSDVKLQLLRRKCFDDYHFLKRKWYGCLQKKDPSFEPPLKDKVQNKIVAEAKKKYADYVLAYKAPTMKEIREENEIVLKYNWTRAEYDEMCLNIFRRKKKPMTFEEYIEQQLKDAAGLCITQYEQGELQDYIKKKATKELDGKMKYPNLVQSIEYTGKLSKLDEYMKDIQAQVSKLKNKIKFIDAILLKREKEKEQINEEEELANLGKD